MKLRQIAFIWLITLGLSVYAQNTVKSVEQVTDAVTLTDAVDYTITSANTPFASAASIDIQNPDATVVFENIRPSVVISRYLGKITANGIKLVNGTNARVSIYRHGAIVFAHSDTQNADGSAFYPVVMCSDDNCTNVIEGYNKTSRYTTGAWKDAARSFILKRGYMCTVANEADGTGYSHCYIANSTDRKITLNKYLAGKLRQMKSIIGNLFAPKNAVPVVQCMNSYIPVAKEQEEAAKPILSTYHNATMKLVNPIMMVTRAHGSRGRTSMPQTTLVHMFWDRTSQIIPEVTKRFTHM